VTSREESRALTHLAALLARDLSKVDPAELAQGVKDAEMAGDKAPGWSGRLIAALHRHGKSWSEIAALTGVSQTTAYRRAQTYL
jgi:transcriptional regulator of acetoin/glycerol metabolism